MDNKKVDTNRKSQNKRSKIFTIFLFSLLIGQIFVFLLMVKIMYTNDLTNSKFDNYVQKKQISKLFGFKEYQSEDEGNNYLLSPDLDFVNSSSDVTYISGFLYQMDSKNGVYTIEVTNTDSSIQEVTLSDSEKLTVCIGDICGNDIASLDSFEKGEPISVFKTWYRDGKISYYIQYK